ncbi:MAG TPA: hypothetical protein VLM80_02320 [Anaerolineales bacterium]|nr:hypothetical protein [Anaerolineales bacterium]
MSAITVLSFSIVNAAENILVPYLITGNLQMIVANPEELTQPANLIALVSILATLLIIMILIGSYWLYRFFGEKYYGVRGAIRWAVFGSLFAIFIMAPEWILPDHWRIVINLLKFFSVFVAFFISRKMIPLQAS